MPLQPVQAHSHGADQLTVKSSLNRQRLKAGDAQQIGSQSSRQQPQQQQHRLGAVPQSETPSLPRWLRRLQPRHGGAQQSQNLLRNLLLCQQDPGAFARQQRKMRLWYRQLQHLPLPLPLQHHGGEKQAATKADGELAKLPKRAAHSNNDVFRHFVATMNELTR